MLIGGRAIGGLDWRGFGFELMVLVEKWEPTL